MPTSQVPQCNILVNGSQVPQKVLRDLLECVIENSLHLPDVCTLRIHDYDFHWLDDPTFQEGNFVSIQLGFDALSLDTVFDGEILGLELDLSAHHVPTMVVRCYDRSHRLHRGRLSRAFVNVTDTDLVNKIGSELGFEVDADDTGQVHDWVMQRNLTNWEFLTERAKRNGFRLYLEGPKSLKFKKVGQEPDDVIQLQWGLDLRSFRPRTSVHQQVDEVTVRGWDPKTKQEIVGTCRSPQVFPAVGEMQDGGQVGSRAFGASKMMVTDRPIHSQQEAEDLAQSVSDMIAGEYLQADGLCDGDTDLKPGVAVQISNIGQRFGGKYYVTATTHIYSPGEGYSTQFAISGKNPNSLVALLDSHEDIKSHPFGTNIVVGIVTDNNDPLKMNRVKVKYPWLTNDHTSFWARMVSPMAGNSRGMFNLPEIDDEVLVAFEQGEVSRPYILGMLWNGVDSVPVVPGKPVLGSASEVNRRGYVTRIGHQMTYDDTDGQGDITFITSNGHHVTFDDANQRIHIQTTGGHQFTMDDQGQNILLQSTGGHMIRLDDAASTVTIMDNASDVITMSEGIVNITAQQTMNLAAPVINITGSMSVNVAAQMTNMSAGMMAAISGGVGVSVDGSAMVTVSGGALVNISGALVNIN